MIGRKTLALEELEDFSRKCSHCSPMAKVKRTVDLPQVSVQWARYKRDVNLNSRWLVFCLQSLQPPCMDMQWRLLRRRRSSMFVCCHHHQAEHFQKENTNSKLSKGDPICNELFYDQSGILYQTEEKSSEI